MSLTSNVNDKAALICAIADTREMVRKKNKSMKNIELKDVFLTKASGYALQYKRI